MSELTASLSHELNQPLTAILYSAQAGKRFLESGKLDDQRAHEIFDSIVEDDKRAGGIISSVRNLMRLEVREMENFNLVSLIHETVHVIHSEAVKQGLDISLQLANSPVFVFGDKVQLQQVLMNFVMNAANAMQNNAPLKKRILIKLHQNKGMAIVAVRDTGPGIDAAIRDRIFDPFITGGKVGFGIGLALCRSIIERHGGEVMAESFAGEGAEFSFKLKVAINE
jgi:signal transduction histidine kinase